MTSLTRGQALEIVGRTLASRAIARSEILDGDAWPPGRVASLGDSAWLE